MIEKIKDKIQMQIFYNNGIVDGKQMHKQRNFNVTNPTATDQNVYDCAIAIASLQKKDVLNIKRADTDILTSN